MAARLTALVTGGASGLGRATALNLAARGMGVVVADITNETDFEDSNIRYAQTDVRSLQLSSQSNMFDVQLNPLRLCLGVRVGLLCGVTDWIGKRYTLVL